LWAHGLNARSRLLAIGQTYHSVSVVTRPGQPIQSLRDLIGRRLSLIKEAGNFSPAQVRSLRAWETVLAVAGIAKSDIEFVPVVADHPSVPFGDVARREVEALLGGQSDVAILFGAKGLELARSANLKEIHRFTAEDIHNDPRLSGLVELRAVTVDRVLLEGRADIVTRILTNLIEAGQWAQAFPKEALKQAAIEGKVETSDAERAYGDRLIEGAVIGLEAEQLVTLESLSGWLKHRHLLPEAHRIDQWAEQDVFQAAKENLRAVA
jgi:ABC-type nitrate/sulfonate/bicarbonate transport system substrate-binding protein